MAVRGAAVPTNPRRDPMGVGYWEGGCVVAESLDKPYHEKADDLPRLGEDDALPRMRWHQLQ